MLPHVLSLMSSVTPLPPRSAQRARGDECLSMSVLDLPKGCRRSYSSYAKGGEGGLLRLLYSDCCKKKPLLSPFSSPFLFLPFRCRLSKACSFAVFLSVRSDLHRSLPPLPSSSCHSHAKNRAAVAAAPRPLLSSPLPLPSPFFTWPKEREEGQFPLQESKRGQKKKKKKRPSFFPSRRSGSVSGKVFGEREGGGQKRPTPFFLSPHCLSLSLGLCLSHTQLLMTIVFSLFFAKNHHLLLLSRLPQQRLSLSLSGRKQHKKRRRRFL